MWRFWYRYITNYKLLLFELVLVKCPNTKFKAVTTFITRSIKQFVKLILHYTYINMPENIVKFVAYIFGLVQIFC